MNRRSPRGVGGSGGGTDSAIEQENGQHQDHHHHSQPLEHRHRQLSGSKGVVLDLHANPRASGSRFENPLWWRYLPSLKPLGLNAMITHQSVSTGPAAASTGVSWPVHSPAHPHYSFFASNEAGDGSIGSSSAYPVSIWNRRMSKKESKAEFKFHGGHHSRTAIAMQQALIRHIRESSPLESLVLYGNIPIDIVLCMFLLFEIT
jgi:hypothetical protein